MVARGETPAFSYRNVFHGLSSLYRCVAAAVWAPCGVVVTLTGPRHVPSLHPPPPPRPSRLEGVAGLMRGVGARVLFHAPATAVSISLFETCRDMVGTTLGYEGW